jgi:hypothetical protein
VGDVGIVKLPREAVVPIASAAAHRAKIVAIVTALLAAACVFAGVADVIGNSSTRNDGAAAFWASLCGIVCAFAVRRAMRAKAAAQRAAGDGETTWTLVGKLVVASDGRGQPAPEHSFKITGAQRKLLLLSRPIAT